MSPTRRINGPHQRIGDLWVHPDYAAALRRGGLCDFDALLTAPGDHRLHKQGLAAWRQRLVLTLDTPGGPQRLFLKRYHCPPLHRQFERLWTRASSTAEIEGSWLQRVADLGIRVPPLVAYGSRRQGAVETDSLLLTAEVPGQSLEQWLPQAVERRALHREAKERIARQLASLVARLHSAGLYHRDLYVSHIFVHPLADGDPELYLIDLQRVRQARWRQRRWRIKDLAALHYSTPATAATAADRIRWMKRYLGTWRLTRPHKALIRAVGRKAARIARHSRKHGLG